MRSVPVFLLVLYVAFLVLLLAPNVLSFSLRAIKTPNDSEEELASIQSWLATSAAASSAKIVFSSPSCLDPTAIVEVKERENGSGWHTLGIVGGLTKSIYHGVFQRNTMDGTIDPCAIGPSEYLRTMTSIAVAVLCSKNNYVDEEEERKKLNFLHLGFGAGSLMRLLGHVIPESQHVAVEIDASVVDAATELGLVTPPNQRIEVGDALAYQRIGNEQRPFHCVCIDVFDGENVMPPEFYSKEFLERLRDNILSENGCVIHNFHTGTDKLALQLKDAKSAYGNVFQAGNIFTLCSLNSDQNGGNTIILTTKTSFLGDAMSTSDEDVGNHFVHLASLAQKHWNIRFDVPSRMNSIQRL